MPHIKQDYTSVWAQYSILANNKTERDNIVKYLKDNKVNVAIFYPAPLHKQECFQKHIGITELPITDDVSERVFNLPCYGEFTQKEQDFIIELLVKYIDTS